MNKENKAVVLLSGGLDSFVSLDIALKEVDVKLALTFNYGQKAFDDEKEAAYNISKHYNIEHRVIDLSYLKELTDNALTNPDNENFNDFKEVWVPNRNGLFLNIGACFCDKLNYKYLIIGMNLEEGRTFLDNSIEFKKAADDFFKYSTLNNVEVMAPCLKFDKFQIINYAIQNNLPLRYLKSCYRASSTSNKKHCLNCMSCKHLYNALLKANRKDIIEEIF